MTHTEIKREGRKVLSRMGYTDSYIGFVLPHWIDGFKRGVRSVQPKRKKVKR